LTLTETDNGDYFEAGGGELSVSAGQPVQPQVVTGVSVKDTVVHGALWLGGKFSETTNFDPLIASMVSSADTSNEPDLTISGWIPSTPVGVVSRLKGSDGQLVENLITVPAQFNNDQRTLRTYSTVLYQTYHAPANVSDFSTPQFISVSTNTLTVTVRVKDDSGIIRVPVLWRTQNQNQWNLLDLQKTGNETWSAVIPYQQTAGERKAVLYLVQALDGAGNVAMMDNNGYEFVIGPGPTTNYLPLIIKN
jgi:hypothetical protein